MRPEGEGTVQTALVDERRSEIPRWQIGAILAGFPALYLVNSFTPWSRALFGRHDYGTAWFVFWGTALVLWWGSVTAAGVVMRRHGWALRDVGIALDRRRRALMLGCAIATGLGAVVVRQSAGRVHALARFVDAWSVSAKPHTTGQRLMWVGIGVVSAVFCEEFVYRGFGLHALRSRGMRTVTAAALASLAWIFVHGLAGVYAFPSYAFLAAILAGVVVWTDSLVPTLVVHALIHVVVILGS